MNVRPAIRIIDLAELNPKFRSNLNCPCIEVSCEIAMQGDCGGDCKGECGVTVEAAEEIHKNGIMHTA